jgi:hypothetical protein
MFVCQSLPAQFGGTLNALGVKLLPIASRVAHALSSLSAICVLSGQNALRKYRSPGKRAIRSALNSRSQCCRKAIRYPSIVGYSRH